jgi:hypothetical protein
MSDEDRDARAAFAKFKSALLKAARADIRLTPLARALVGAIADRIYSATGYCGGPSPSCRPTSGRSAVAPSGPQSPSWSERSTSLSSVRRVVARRRTTSACRSRPRNPDKMSPFRLETVTSKRGH